MRTILTVSALSCALAHSTHWQAATLPHAQETHYTSAHTGHTYRIQTAAIGNAPAQGYPVLYLLDGDNYFPHAAQLAHTLLCKPADSQCRPLLIVGIGYAGGRHLDLAKRARDYTPPSDSADPKHGGAALFTRFLNDELPPLLRAQHPVNLEKQSLYGHSYGGLYALYHLSRETPYAHYFISSPSIWWDTRSILAQLPQTTPARIHISVGSLEKPDANDPVRQQRAMIDNARQAAAKLNARFILLEHETHGSAAFQAIHRMMQTFAETTIE